MHNIVCCVLFWKFILCGMVVHYFYFFRTELSIDLVETQDDPSQEAVFVFEDIVRQASYSNIKPVVSSILTYVGFS